MTPEIIKRKRVDSILKEVIPEALSILDDALLNSLCITEVNSSKGRYDANVYLDKSYYNKEEQNYILNHLKKVSHYLQAHCQNTLGWYRVPKFHFKFDEKLEEQNKIDALFNKIQTELAKSNNGA